MQINPMEKKFRATQSQQAVLKYVENKYSPKQGDLLTIISESVPSNNIFLSAIAPRSG
jgi:hypothetical protein